METWRPVRDIKGRLVRGYEVSDRGRVRSFIKPGGDGAIDSKPRLKTTFPDALGFLNVSLRRKNGGPCYVFMVHQLVALAFVGRPPAPAKRHVIVHLNDQRTDNRPANLRWVTRAEATQRSMKRRPRRGPAKLTLRKVLAIRRSKRPVREIAEKHGVMVQTIYGIIKRKTWRDERRG